MLNEDNKMSNPNIVANLLFVSVTLNIFFILTWLTTNYEIKIKRKILK